VNTAGVFIGKLFTDYTIDDYQLIVRVNLTGFFLETRRVTAAMLNSGGGHVVNLSTTMVEHANSSAPALLASLTNGGLAATTRSLAIECASRGIRANAVSLGVIETPMNPPEAFAALAKLHPIGRVGQVSDVVADILYLESGPFVTARSCISTAARAPATEPGKCALEPRDGRHRTYQEGSEHHEIRRRSNHPRRQPRPKAERAQVKAAQARAELAEVEAQVAQERAAAIAKALQEDDEVRRQADLQEVAEKEAEAMPDWP
jgi:Enoyl-(Acyl carrier protein) reductase